MKLRMILCALGAVAIAAGGCGKRTDENKKGGGAGEGGGAPAGDTITGGPGVDLDKKVLYIGALNDESGPALQIGKPFAAGKRLLARVVNAGGSGILPEGWKIELVERDHGYNPTKSVQEYKAIKDKVLFIGTSFGTVNTLPLQKQLERDGLIAYPASLSSEMAAHAHTPPLAPSYKVEAMRAMDWAVEHAGGADKIKAGIVYQKDDYGNDGIAGWKEAAEHHKVSIVAEHAIKPGEKDVAAVIKGLQEKGANYVLLTILPSSTGPVLGTAAATKYAPVWIGNTPAWIDAFFSEQVQASLPPAVFGKFYWVTGLSYWGEDVPALASFRATWDKHGKDLGPPDFYILASYAQGLTQVEAFRIALENKDVSRAGYLKAVQSLKEFTAGGMFQPIDLTKVPYVTSTQTRVLQPDFAGKTWKEVAGYAAPQAMAAK